ncbi:P97 family adhesin [Mesomycoplasma ovipneumoniae]|uniref:P97 family adhesin n=1 Tax=Mesomycoplasma ovipneumoniae TaxID=29562 RepID=UPI00311B015C
MSKPKQKSLFNVLRKNILSKTGIAVSLFGIGVFTATAVLTTRISYSGNPRENVQNFAKKINLVSFKLGDLSANDDYYSIKNIIFDENGNKQNDLDLSRLVDVFQKINDLNQKIDLTDEVDLQKPHLKFVDITANDNSRSFEIKYQVKQKLPDQSFVYSDIYSQEISFLQKSQFLRSNFSSKLQKIIKLFQTKFSSLKDKNSAKEFSADLENTQTTLKDNIFLSRAEDISSFFNLARTSKELENKISKLLPQIEHILFDLYNSEENLIPDSNNKIFNFSFEKNQLTNEYAFVDGSGFLNLFLKAEFSLEAQKLLDFPEVKSWIEPVRIVDSEGKSLFTTSKSLIESIELSNIAPKKLVNISVLDFLNLLQTKFTLSNFDIKNEKINKEIVQIINQVLEKPLNIGLKNSSNKLPNEGVNLVFDPFNVEISKNDSKFDLKLPYKIQISEKFYGNESSEIVEEKLGVLNLENFSIIDENSDQKIDDGRYFLFLNPNFDLKMLKKDDAAKDKQELPETENSQKTEESEPKQVAVQDGVVAESTTTTAPTTTDTTETTSQSDSTAQTESTTEVEGNTQTKKQPKYKYFLLDSNNPYSKNEIDQLIQDNDFEKLSRNLQSLSGYNYNFSDHESLIKAWSGTLVFPFDYANSFVKDTSLHAQKTGTISLNSTQFLQNPNETGAFYSFLAKQNPRIVVQAFVDFLKTSGLIFNFVDLDRDYNFDWNKIFESARQVRLNSSNFKKFSFNNQYTNLESSGFLSTLFLPKDIKSKISTLKNDGTILESLTSLNLFALNSDEIAKFEKIDENIANFETLADVISAFYFKAGLLNNYQNWSEIALLDSEIIFEPNEEISLSELEEIKKQNPSSGQSDDISKHYKAINYYYKLGIKDESGKISVPLFESPKTTLILKTIDEKTAKINEITKKLDQIIDAIPVSYQTIHLSAEDFDKLTNANSTTTSGTGGSVTVQAALISSLSSKNLEPKVPVNLFSDAEQTQQGQGEQAEVEQQVQEAETERETQEAVEEQQTEETMTTENGGETEAPVEPKQEQDELTKKLPKFGAEISQILTQSFTSLFTSTEKDNPKLKINIEIKDDILKDPNKKLITIQVGILESYLEKLTAEEKTDQEAKKDEKNSEQPQTDQEQSDNASTSGQAETAQQPNSGTISDQGQTAQEGNTGSSETETVQTKQVLASEETPTPAPVAPAPASPPATPAPAEVPEQPKEEKYRYSKRFNITVIKQASQSQTTTESTTPSNIEQS